MEGPLVHLVDVASPPDRLFQAVVRPEDVVIRRRCDEALLRLRGGIALRQIGADRVVAWSDDACRVALATPASIVFHRPRPEAVRPIGRSVPLCHGPTQQRRLGGVVVEQPATPAEPDRPGDGAFRWLLSADATPGGGLDVAVWAATLLYVLMRQEGRRHLILMAPGDAPRLRRARRFADQLGLAAMIEPTHGLTYEQAAARADAVLLTPTGPCDPWPARVARATGLPAVATRSRTVRDVYGDKAFESESSLPRHLTREMLRLANSHPGLVDSDASKRSQIVAAWEEAMVWEGPPEASSASPGDSRTSAAATLS